MPTYEYRCAEGHEFEVFQRMSDAPEAACPECGEPAERMLSAGAGLLFKGEGFYITDYRSEDYKKAAKADGGSEGKGAGSDASSGNGKSSSAGKTSGGASGNGTSDSTESS